jgi:hypothetical protein
MILIYVNMSFRHRFLRPIVSPAYPVVSSRIVPNNNDDGTIDCVLQKFRPSEIDLPPYNEYQLDSILLRGEPIKEVDSSVLGINPASIDGAIDSIIGKEEESSSEE